MTASSSIHVFGINQENTLMISCFYVTKNTFEPCARYFLRARASIFNVVNNYSPKWS